MMIGPHKPSKGGNIIIIQIHLKRKFKKDRM